MGLSWGVVGCGSACVCVCVMKRVLYAYCGHTENFLQSQLVCDELELCGIVPVCHDTDSKNVLVNTQVLGV